MKGIGVMGMARGKDARGQPREVPSTSCRALLMATLAPKDSSPFCLDFIYPATSS